MPHLPEDPIGAAWLARTFKVMPLSQFPVISQIGGRRITEIRDGFKLETYQEVIRPDAEPAAHLQFHLRNEVIHLEFLARLFAQTGSDFIQAWIDQEPTGQYARRAAFLYEWLTDTTLTAPDRLSGNYVDVLDTDKQVTVSDGLAIKVQRWRVKDNLPGTRYFCPAIVKTTGVLAASALDIPALFKDLETEFGEDLLMRSAVWLTLRESKASFAIEGEADQSSRVQRFADVMARRTGQGDSPITAHSLAELQKDILGPKNTITHFGLRQSPVFVSEVAHFQEYVHYVAPPSEDITNMLAGVRTFLDKTQGQSSVMRSAVAAFGFIYIHPLSDGNGRVHRFLINDVLRRDGVIPAPVILPVSAVISGETAERSHYNKTLDDVSKPLMEAVRDLITFTSKRINYPDGVTSNFKFDGNDLARPLWRYPDLGAHVIFLSKIIHRTLTEQMREESRYLQFNTRARAALKEIVEMPNHQADRVLRSIEQNNKQLSGALAKEIPILAEAGIWEAIVEAIEQASKENKS